MRRVSGLSEEDRSMRNSISDQNTLQEVFFFLKKTRHYLDLNNKHNEMLEVLGFVTSNFKDKHVVDIDGC